MRIARPLRDGSAAPPEVVNPDGGNPIVLRQSRVTHYATTGSGLAMVTFFEDPIRL
jgi:hypothetical protein